MKKNKSLLSIALVLAMALSILPATFASAADDTVSVTYDFAGNYNAGVATDITKYTYAITGNSWEYANRYNASTTDIVLSSSHGVFVRNGTSKNVGAENVNSWIAIKIKVPVSGYYSSMTIKPYSTSSNTNKLDVFVVDMKDENLKALLEKKATTEVSGADEGDTASSDLDDFSPIINDCDIKSKTSVDASFDKKFLSSDGEYCLIFKIDCGTDSAQARIKSITLSGVKGIEPTAVFSAATNVLDNDVVVTVDGIANENKIISAPRGSAISATAPEISGYKFVGWKRGSNNENDDYKSYISDKNPLEMSLLTNTFVTACYVEDDYEAQAMVEYYNQNGDYIATKSKDEAAPTPGAITGFTFEEGNWFIGENTKLDLEAVTSLTRAVARHTPNANAGKATVNGTPVSDKTAFDSAITPVATEGFTAWKRDGKVVSYNQEYTYYLWDDTAITESTEAIPDSAKSGDKKLPLIVLESGNGGAYMIEYDKADFEIVEVGILFTTAGEPTVDSCTAKYTSQRNSAHGQFTAKADGTAKGYLIYKDGDAYKVIYATAE